MLGQRAADGRPSHLGPYRILDTLGAGGMGVVYLAEQKEPVRRRVAVKVVRHGMDSAAVLARFDAERRALAMMEHSCIATVFDAGISDDGQPYFVMEYVKGIPITDYCDQNRVGLQQRIELFRSVCSGVQHAHLKGVVHRDLKPSNVLVTTQDGKPTPKIIDFGLAKATDHHLIGQTLFTELGQIIGTPEYMSPEQTGLGGLDVDSRTDVYSLGVLLYELLVGELPLTRRDLREAGYLEMQRVIREQEPLRPSVRISTVGADAERHAAARRVDVSGLRRQLRGDLDWIVLKALEKDRARRYETAQELAADLGRHLAFEPVLARQPSVGYRVRKFVRRYRMQTAAAGLVLLTIVGGTIGTALGFAAAREQAQAAEKSATLANERAARIAELLAAERQHSEENGIYADAARLRTAIALENDLYPALPEKIPDMQRWLHDYGEPLRDRLPALQSILGRLRERALPQTEGQRRADAESHPEWQRLQQVRAEIVALHAASPVRAGREVVPIPALDADTIAMSAGELNELAWRLVDPDHPVVGDWPRAVAMARLALRRLDDGDVSQDRSSVLDTLAWACHKVGLDDEAMEHSRAAVAACEPSRRSDFAHYAERLERSVTRLRDSSPSVSDDLERQRASLAELVAARRTWSFADQADDYLHSTLLELQGMLAEFTGAEGQLSSVQRRLLQAATVVGRTIDAHREAWDRAVAGVLASDDVVGSRLYDHLSLQPQVGFVPVGMDPQSRLWEFVHLASGKPGREIPTRSRDSGRIAPDADMGVVFVLVPGGTLPVADGRPAEARHRAGIEPFLIGKFEITREQWLRLGGYATPWPDDPASHLPVTGISWFAAVDVLRRHGWALPTQQQWEYGCRGGTTTPWWTGRDAASLHGRERPWDADPIVGWGARPVGELAPNPFGLFDVAGNVWEWCRDATDPDSTGSRFLRGGSFGEPRELGVSSGWVTLWNANAPLAAAGVRPVVALRP